jgi:hypothetical protein
MTGPRGRVALELGLVVVGFVLAGAAAGFVWERIWTPPNGVVVEHQWRPEDAIALQQQFSGTGWYVIVGMVAGLVLGVGASLLVDRVPLLTLAAVLVGAALAAWMMSSVGSSLGPGDPHQLAKSAADGTRLPSQLEVSGWSPFVALPVGALIGLLIVLIGLGPRAGHPQPDEERAPDAAPAG